MPILHRCSILTSNKRHPIVFGGKMNGHKFCYPLRLRNGHWMCHRVLLAASNFLLESIKTEKAWSKKEGLVCSFGGYSEIGVMNLKNADILFRVSLQKTQLLSLEFQNLDFLGFLSLVKPKTKHSNFVKLLKRTSNFKI